MSYTKNIETEAAAETPAPSGQTAANGQAETAAQTGAGKEAVPTEQAGPTEAQRLRALIEKAWNTDPDTKLSLFVTYLEDDEEFLLAAKYATIIKAALEFE